ncbi:MAG: helix-turn-helix domain-containing protein [Pseudomonadota bacterium]
MTVRFHVRHAQRLIAGAGLDPAGIAKAAGLPEHVLGDDANGELPLVEYFRLRSLVMEQVRDETCHLSERQLLPGSTEFVRQHIPEEGTLTDAMRIVATSYNLLHGGEFNRVEETSSHIVFSVDDNTFPYTPEVTADEAFFLMETTLVFLHAFLSTIAPAPAVRGLSRVRVKRPHAPSAESHLAFWRVPIEMQAQEYSLLYTREEADAQIRFRRDEGTVDGRIDQMLRYGRTSDQTPIESQVAGFIEAGLHDQAAVAAAMGVSTATLRRYLSAQGLSFRGLRQRILDEKAKWLIADGLPPVEVAERLGFSDVRSFNRAFKAWNGVTPKGYGHPEVS